VARRPRTLHVLFVRSGDTGALPRYFRLGSSPERGSELPFGLLRLASAVKFGSAHRVSVYDARNPSNAKLRTAAAIHRPDVAIVWLDPALLASGLEAARAVRHAGCPLVLGAGPLVDTWLDGARRIPEIDGLLRSDAAAALVAALATIATEGSAGSLAAALEGHGVHSADLEWTLDRKLVDYAAYTASAEGWPPPQIPPPSRVLGIGGTSDKGRFAASRVVMADLGGALLSPQEVLADMRSCSLLGIPWQELRPSPTGTAPDAAWWSALFALLRSSPSLGRTIPTRLRIQSSPSVVRTFPMSELRSLGVSCIDLADVHCDSSGAVEEALAAGRSVRRTGLDFSLTALLGTSGSSIADEEQGLRALRRSSARVRVRVDVQVGGEDPPAWASWLEAPDPRFVPPGITPQRLRLLP
jgi:hypothetical protein